MKTLIVYDSWYGNTEKIAKAIAKIFSKKGKVILLKPDKVKPIHYKGMTCMIVGSPTHGGRPTEPIQKFLKAIPEEKIQGIKVAAFDTRVLAEKQKTWLKLLFKVIDFAAPRIADSLKRKGGILAVPPEGFIVEDKEGPLQKGESKRATAWAKEILLTKT